uniref:Uncharacterized protein n=1 Tax=Rhodopseudomonas palustris (strain BisA53) TaxID=316055 RepID=Q07SP4_RHOP5
MDMLVAAIVIFLTGAVIGLRFKVFAIVPVVLIGWFGFAIFSMIADVGLLWIAVGFVGIALLAQFGFVFGVSTQLATAAARVGRRRYNATRDTVTSEPPPIRPAVR